MKLNPCIENLSDMSIVDNGRFCSSCSRTVVDLTEKSNEEIQILYVENNGKLCGIVKPNQLQENKHYHPLKKFALALLLVFGSTLFVISCDAGFSFTDFQNQAYVELTQSESNSVIKGFVYSKGAPIINAEVSYKEGEIIYLAKTDSSGAFELNLPETQNVKIEIIVKSHGFEEVKKIITLSGSQIFAGKINLEKEIIECSKGEIVPLKMGKVALPQSNERHELGEIEAPIHKAGMIAEPERLKGDIAAPKKDLEFD